MRPWTCTFKLASLNTTLSDITDCIKAVAAGKHYINNPDGRDLRNATVTITDTEGISRTVMPNSLGYYHFDRVHYVCNLPYNTSDWIRVSLFRK